METTKVHVLETITACTHWLYLPTFIISIILTVDLSTSCVCISVLCIVNCSQTNNPKKHKDAWAGALV